MVRNRSRLILILLVLILLIASLLFGLLTYWPRLALPHGMEPGQDPPRLSRVSDSFGFGPGEQRCSRSPFHRAAM